jgi:predicted nucleic acid-binding protein
LERIAAGTVLWLSAVVLEELYAGAGARDREYVEQLEQRFGHAGKILLPDLDDWIQAGKLLQRLALKYDYEKIGRGRLTNDALIAMSAARMGVRVITANENDFRKLAEFRDFAWQFVTL